MLVECFPLRFGQQLLYLINLVCEIGRFRSLQTWFTLFFFLFWKDSDTEYGCHVACSGMEIRKVRGPSLNKLPIDLGSDCQNLILLLTKRWKMDSFVYIQFVLNSLTYTETISYEWIRGFKWSCMSLGVIIFLRYFTLKPMLNFWIIMWCK